jgi:hypothetical protein
MTFRQRARGLVLGALVAPLVTMFACAPHTPPATPSSPTHPTTEQSPFAAAAELTALPRSPDISTEVMGWVVVRDGDELARQLAPDQPNGDPRVVQQQLLTQLGLHPDVAATVDLHRPVAVALLNPGLLATKSVQPYVAMVPVRSRAAVEQVMAAHHAPVETTPWGFSLPSGQAKMHVAFVANYAVVAWRADLLQATVRLLGPRLAHRADAPVVFHVAFDNLRAAYGPQIDLMVQQLARMAGGGGDTGDPQVAWALRGLRHLGPYLRSLKSIDLLGTLDSGGLTLTLRAEDKEGGALSGYVQEQRPGPAWGVQFLPRDSVLAYATHRSRAGEAADIAASVDYLADVTPEKPAGLDERARVQRALERASATTEGELAYAVWPGRSGGVGVGGAYRVNNPVAARAAVAGVYDTLAPRLGAVVMRALLFDPDKLARHVRVQKRTERLGDVEVDLIEVGVHWPKESEAERRVFESLFGKRLVLATAFVGDQALFTIGADYQQRLAAMIATARGVPAASLGDEPAFAEALQYKQSTRVSLSYLETARMARFAAGLVEQSGTLDQAQERAVARLLVGVGRGAIISTTNADGRRFEMTTHVPHSAITGVAALNGALWRIALSPLLNPPMMPPMPVPPPHVAPSVNKPATNGTM